MVPNRSFPEPRYSTLAEDVRSDSTFQIPIIDFSAFRATAAPSERWRVADNVVNAFKEVGFVYLTGHGIPADVIDNVYKKSAAFFSLPQEIKSSDATEIAALRAKAPDTKESIEIGRDWDPIWRNKWPDETNSPGFQQTMLHFYQICHGLHVDVMRSIALGMDLHESFFDQRIDQQYHNLRLLSYPSIPTKLLSQEGQARAGAHSDYGTITLLFQDTVGGLEVQNPHTRQFQPAHPIPGTVVVNPGDLLARWSNDVLRSTLHRVVAPPAQKVGDGQGMTPARQSIAFFCSPNSDTVIEPLPTCVSETNPSRYEPVSTEEYIIGRLADTYD